jgi:hypothetical protein
VLARFVGGPLDGIERVLEDARPEWRFPLRSLPAPLPVDDEPQERFVTYRRGHLADDGAVLYSLAEPELS